MTRSTDAGVEVLAVVEKVGAKQADVIDGHRPIVVGDWYWFAIREEDRSWADEEKEDDTEEKVLEKEERDSLEDEPQGASQYSEKGSKARKLYDAWRKRRGAQADAMQAAQSARAAAKRAAFEAKKAARPAVFHKLVCVTHVGSNYAELTGPTEGGHDQNDTLSYRVHFDNFESRCTFVDNPVAAIDMKIASFQEKTKTLMLAVQREVARLHMGNVAGALVGDAIPGGEEVSALALYGQSNEPVEAYKKALVKAKSVALPSLFKRIEASHRMLATWMKAKLIPWEACTSGMRAVMDKIEDRIFNVELYAGLVESIVQIKDGASAPLTEKIHLFQRRAYMDEECLAQYQAGGMDIHSIEVFDEWICKPENLSRLLPFERCLVAFRVRRYTKERPCTTLAQFIRIASEMQTDKWTYLYMRNGEQVFRLRTSIEFDEQLFPDLDAQKLDRGVLYHNPRAYSGRGNDRVISHDEYVGMKEDFKRKMAEYEVNRAAYDAKQKTKSKEERSPFGYPGSRPEDASSGYAPLNHDSVYYDDTIAVIEKNVGKHNRVVLVLQGLLDRSPVFAPHPPWILGTGAGFRAALYLVYDDSRTLTTGDKPDFEAYRARLNASLKAGSITLGQEDVWERVEADKYNEYKRTHSWKFSQSDRYRETERHRPYGNPGPGTFARVVSCTKKSCKFAWLKKRQKRTRYGAMDTFVDCSLTVERSKLFHVDAYTPGDFKIFFNDPRSRADYLQWAPLLLEAEEYHAGNRKVGTTSDDV